ncbi:MAG TPA: DUF4390 domain-containing protein [Methylotenera sp.]|nr:DUF4390 domain-containing protein [Methylotenera sp.]
MPSLLTTTLYTFTGFAFTQLAFADGAIQINTAELHVADDFYSLATDVDVRLDKDIEEAVNKGVPLNFIVEFQIVIPREYWFDDEVVTATQNITLRYHALTRQYLVNRSKYQQGFETLNEALSDLATFNEWKVVEKSQLEKNEPYQAALLIRLDQSKLPKAIQVDAIGSEKWNLSSEKFEWTLKELRSKDLQSKEFKQ